MNPGQKIRPSNNQHTHKKKRKERERERENLLFSGLYHLDRPQSGTPPPKRDKYKYLDSSERPPANVGVKSLQGVIYIYIYNKGIIDNLKTLWNDMLICNTIN